MFEHIPPYPGDPILSLMEQFNADARQHKVNLSIGYYYDEEGAVPQLTTLLEAQQHLENFKEKVKLYLPMEGLPSYRTAIQTLLLGEDSPAIKQGRATTIQTLGGSGALKVAADFLKHYFPSSAIWVSQPTWDNHIAIFKQAGFDTFDYPYFDPETKKVNFKAMLSTLKELPPKSIVLLHPCCHNPTGADLSVQEWDQVISVIKERDLIAFMDIAYQGFGEDLDQDTYAIRAMDRAGLNFIISNSFSKIFSLYGERVGGLTFLCDNRESAECTLGQLKATVRCIYSSPPTTGAYLVDHILNNQSLKQKWQDELKGMRERIIRMRHTLYDKLSKALPEYHFEYLKEQKGMFSYTGLSAEQVDKLREHDGIYLIQSGRMCIAGLNTNNIDHVINALIKVFKEG